MASRKSRLKLRHQDLAINADVRTAKLTPQDVVDRPEIVRRDEQTDALVVRQLYDKASGDPLDEGYGYRWVTEDGTEVPTEDLQLYAIEDGREVPFELHEPTVGSDRTITAERWIPAATVDQYLVESTYEIWGEEPMDVAQLYELAIHIRDFDEAPVVPFVLTPSVYRRWGIVTPVFFADTFGVIVRVTDQKIEPEHAMEVVTPEAAAEAAEAADETLDQRSPFE